MEDERAKVVAVTVTYGERLPFVRTLLEQLLESEGVGSVVVVDNASANSLSEIEAKWGDRVSIVRLVENGGSAVGYAAGIEAALAGGGRYLWLLDDDNLPRSGAGVFLLDALHRLIKEVGESGAAVLGFREARSKALSAPEAEFAPDSSFVGFDIRQLRSKILGRLGLSAPRRSATRSLDVPYGPYGGLFAHREAFLACGLPNTDMVVYGDDWEYTMRLTRMGGIIRLVPEAVIADQEVSWNALDSRPSIFRQSICGGSDFRVYYSYRNHVWLCWNFRSSSRVIYGMNKRIFLVVLSFYALLYRRMGRLSLILNAIRDGEKGKLGVKLSMPLTSSSRVAV